LAGNSSPGKKPRGSSARDGLSNAATLKAIAIGHTATFAAIENQHAIEKDAEVRLAFLSALNNLAPPSQDWSDRLKSILDSAETDREKFYAGAYLAQRLGHSTPQRFTQEMPSLFYTLPETPYPYELSDLEDPTELFWASLCAVDQANATTLLIAALRGCGGNSDYASSTKVIHIAEWLLRRVSDDTRTGWEQTSYSQGPKIEYCGVQDGAKAASGWGREKDCWL
jgi:hypothetical protein